MRDGEVCLLSDLFPLLWVTLAPGRLNHAGLAKEERPNKGQHVALLVGEWVRGQSAHQTKKPLPVTTPSAKGVLCATWQNDTHWWYMQEGSGGGGWGSSTVVRPYWFCNSFNL